MFWKRKVQALSSMQTNFQQNLIIFQISQNRPKV